MTTSTDPRQSPIDGALAELRRAFPARFAAAKTEQDLRDENAKILGKKGELTAILKGMGSVPADARKAIGEKVNALKEDVERAFEARLREIALAKRDAELNARPYDLTLPGRSPGVAGHEHPLSIVREEILAVFRGMGFAVHDSPEI